MKIPLCLISRCFAAAAFSPVPRLSPAAGEPAIGLLDAPQVGFPLRDHIQRVALTMVSVVLLCLSAKAAGFEAYYTRLDRSLKGNAGKYSDMVVVPGQTNRLEVPSANGYLPQWRTTGGVHQVENLSPVPLYHWASDDGMKPHGDKVKMAPSTREIKLTGKLLLYPVSHEKTAGNREGMLSVRVDGTLIHNVDGFMAQTKEQVAWWAYLEMDEYVGKTATLTFSSPDAGPGLAMIESSDQERHLLPLYDETYRPQFHHSQKQGWNNDPNGMVYYDGEYHLFWQCNPVGNQWGNMYWGHSTSPDMIHWTEQRRALRPFGGPYTPDRHPSLANKNCFSGSANVDSNNTGGWQTGTGKTMVALFTDTGCGESLAYSNDRGRHWTYYDKNPVIGHDGGRDPKLVWYEPGNHWVTAVYDEDRDKKIGSNIAFYSSNNLKDWTLTSKLPGFYECPELFELPVDGDKNNTRWVVFACDSKYVVGGFSLLANKS